MNLFTLGGRQFMSWVTGIIPAIVTLLALMNAIKMSGRLIRELMGLG